MSRKAKSLPIVPNVIVASKCLVHFWLADSFGMAKKQSLFPRELLLAFLMLESYKMAYLKACSLHHKLSIHTEACEQSQ